MNRPAKARIRQSFERAAATYDRAAVVQREICDRLADSLPVGLRPGRIVDAGCGTGYAHGRLRQRFPDSQLIALDLSTAMLCRVDASSQRVAGDLEHLPLADGSIDLYWSSLAVQWCDLPSALAEARRVLRTGGHLALSSLGPATFHELRQAFQGIDRHQHTLSFLTPAAIDEAARAAGWTAVDLICRQKTLHYPDLRSLLRAVKAVGANQLGTGRRTGLMSRGTLTRVEAAYESLRQPDGLPLTYDIITLHARP